VKTKTRKKDKNIRDTEKQAVEYFQDTNGSEGLADSSFTQSIKKMDKRKIETSNKKRERQEEKL